MSKLFLFLGMAFGFLLSRAGATTYDYYAKLFLFQDLQLLWVISAAVAVGIPGMALLRRLGRRSVLGAQPMQLEGRQMARRLPLGAVLLGLGWGLAAACPGTVLVMLGEGKLAALFTIAGITFGTYLYGWKQSHRLGLL
jgi:uncharacterized protein